MGILDPLTWLLEKLYAGQEATVKTGSKLGKEYIRAVYCHPVYLYAEYSMSNVRLDEAQGRIKVAGRNINNFRYADDTTLWQKAKRNQRAS